MSIDRNILEQEVRFRTSRSSGPGGQSVNKTETRVEVLFEIDASQLFNDDQKVRIRKKLESRLTNDGVLIVAASDHRSQWANKRAAVDRMVWLLEDAIKVTRPRKATKPSKGAMKRRIERKVQRSEIKKSRKWKYGD